MALSHERPEILAAPEEPPTCCTQKTLTVPPSVIRSRFSFDYIVNFHLCPVRSNELTESLNNLITRIKRIFFEFRSFKTYRIRALLYAC